MTAPLAERLREMTALWHLWRACMTEELGELPPGLEDAVRATLEECLREARGRLDDAARACDESLASLRTSG